MSDDHLKKIIQLTKDVEHQTKIINGAFKLQKLLNELSNMEEFDAEALIKINNALKEMKFHKEESKRWKEGVYKDRDED